MSSFLETFIGHQVSRSISAAGTCTHGCSANVPFHICEIEANELNRFDPDAFSALSTFGVTVEKVTNDDIDKVAEKVPLLGSLLHAHGDGKNEFLYKYAMSLRGKKPLLISKQDPHHGVHVDCAKKFKNRLLEFS